MRSEQWTIAFRLAYRTITVMTGRLLWLQHASRGSASWYKYLSVCGLTNFTHWRAKLITCHFYEKLHTYGRKNTFPSNTAMFCHRNINLKLILMCQSIEMCLVISSELSSSQHVVVCSKVDKNSLSEVGQGARRSSPACYYASVPNRPHTPPCTATHENPHTTHGAQWDCIDCCVKQWHGVRRLKLYCIKDREEMLSMVL